LEEEKEAQRVKLEGERDAESAKLKEALFKVRGGGKDREKN
jgi:hypothetical protein